VSWSEENAPILVGTLDDPVSVDMPPAPVIAAALGHLLLCPPPIPSPPSKNICPRAPADDAARAKGHSLSPRISALKAETNQPVLPAGYARPSPRIKRLNLLDFVVAESGMMWMEAGGRGGAVSAAKNQELFGAAAAANSMRPEELPTTPSLHSPSDAAAAAVAGAALSSSSAAALLFQSSDIKSQLISGSFISCLSPPTFSHDFSSLPPPPLPSARSVWSLPPPSLRRHARRLEDAAKEVQPRICSTPRLADAFVLGENSLDDDGIGDTYGTIAEDALSDAFDYNASQLRLGPIGAQQQQQRQQRQPPTQHPNLKCTTQVASPRPKPEVARLRKGSTVAAAAAAAAASASAAASNIPSLSAVPVAHVNFQTLTFADSCGIIQNAAAPPPSAEFFAGSARPSPRHAPACSSLQLTLPQRAGEDAEKSATESAVFAKLVKMERQ
jgi:hypothetical protein